MTKPTFFPANSTTAILNAIGAPSATYPGVQDILDFNASYGIWISAPPGTSASPLINSFYGGAYVTTLGSLEPLYQVGEGSDGNPNFNELILLTSGNIGSPFTAVSKYPTYAVNVVTIDKLLPIYLNTASVGSGIPAPTSPANLFLNYTRSDGTFASVAMILAGTNIYVLNPTTGTLAGGNTTPTVIGTVTSSATTGYNQIALQGVNGAGYTTLSGYSDLNFTNSTLNTYLTALSATSGAIQFQYVMNATGMICAALYQTSPRNTPGVLTLSKIDVAPTVTVNGQTVANPTYNTITFTYGSELSYGTVTYSATYPALSSNITSVDATNQSNYLLSGLAGDQFINAQVFQDFITSMPTVALGTVTGITLTPSTPIWTGSGATTQETVTYTLAGTVTNATSGSLLINNNPYFFNVGTSATTIAAALGALPASGNDTFSYTSGNVFTVTSSTNVATFVGTRGVLNGSWSDSTMLVPLLTTGWNYAPNQEYQNTQLFFDPHRQLAIATIFASLRGGSSNPPFPFATFITAISVADGIPTNASALQIATNNIITARATYPSVTGLAYYCNEFYLTESVNGTSYWGFPIGAVAEMLALIMDNKLGGVAPMFTNEGTPSLGGQFNKSVKKGKFNFNANQLDQLDAAGINPLILDPFYGLMATGHRTAQSPATLNDWSYLGHTMAFDLFRAEMKQDVMIPQIGKAIDPPHMALRQKDGQAIMDKRLTGATAIWNSGKVDATTPNTPETMAANTFMISARVKVNEFSEFVELILDDLAQTDTV